MAEKCSICDIEFGFFFNRKCTCAQCNTVCCSSCFEALPATEWLCVDPYENISTTFFILTLSNWVCVNCWKRDIQPIATKYEQACASMDEVELVSRSYKGKASRYNNQPIRIQTPFCREKADVETYLKVTARFLNRSTVNQMEWIRDTESESTPKGGTYHYSVWAARGVACNP